MQIVWMDNIFHRIMYFRLECESRHRVNHGNFLIYYSLVGRERERESERRAKKFRLRKYARSAYIKINKLSRLRVAHLACLREHWNKKRDVNSLRAKQQRKWSWVLDFMIGTRLVLIRKYDFPLKQPIRRTRNQRTHFIKSFSGWVRDSLPICRRCRH